MADLSIEEMRKQYANMPEVLAYVNAAAAANPEAAKTQGVVVNPPPAPTPAPVVTPKVTPLNTASLFAPQTSDTSLAAGFPMLAQMIDFNLRSQLQNSQIALAENADKRAQIDQSVSIARLMADLERVTVMRAAAMAASMGVKPDDSISFTNLFGTGRAFPAAGGDRVSGTIGGVPISLPSVLSGQELSFLNANPILARVMMDVADALGVPDIFSRSAAARLPTMGNIFAGGI